MAEKPKPLPLCVGDHVEWMGHYAHLGCLSPFEIYEINGEWATLKWISVPVRLKDLKVIDR